MSTKVVDTSTMSAECALAQRPGYTDLHRQCSQTEDVPLPHSDGILLVHRCTCPHHVYNRELANADLLRFLDGTAAAGPIPDGGYELQLELPAEGAS